MVDKKIKNKGGCSVIIIYFWKNERGERSGNNRGVFHIWWKSGRFENVEKMWEKGLAFLK